VRRFPGFTAARALAAAASVGVATTAAAEPPPDKHNGVTSVQIHAIVSIPPLKALVEPFVHAAAGDATGAAPDVDILIPPGTSEHGYEVPPAKLAILAKADVVISIGLALEPQLDDFLADHPSPTRRGVEFAHVVGVDGSHEHAQDARHHDHDEHDHDHEHLGPDPHLWLDPALVARLVPAIREAVELAAAAQAAQRGATLDPDVHRRLAAAEESLLARVRALDDEHRTRLAPHHGRVIVVSHDAWGRLAERYGLRTAAIKGLLATEPTPQSIKAAVEAVRAQGRGGNGGGVIFTEPQLSKTTAQRIADAAGARLVEIDPLGSGDWFATMHSNLDKIVAALEAQAPAAPAGAPR
jgi:zinc transport system substrate-binding protein